MEFDEELSRPLLLASEHSSVDRPLPLTQVVTEMRFALQGLSCSSCTAMVRQAVQSMEDVDFLSVSVALLPEQLLTVRYQHHGHAGGRSTAVSEQIIQCIENIGFEATLLSQEQLAQPSTENFSSVNKYEPTTAQYRVLFVNVEFNAPVALTFFQQSSHVQSVQPIDHTLHRQHVRNTLFNALRSGVVTTSDGRSYSQLPSMQEDTPTTFKVTFDQQAIGVRDLLQTLDEYSRDQGGVGAITVSDPTSYKLKHDTQEQRRSKDIDSWRDGFIYAAIFSIPVFLLAMVLPNFPRINRVFISEYLWNIRYDELLQLVLSTPVQFFPGARFYRDAYFSIKARSLGMSFLIASGTTAAYIYSCYVVYHNSRYSTPPPPHFQNDNNFSMQHGDDRMMPNFETSTLLITFVYLGKYLECRAKGYASRAISQLAQLTPETAVLIGISRPQTNETLSDTSDTNQSTTPIHYHLEEREISLDLLQKNDVLLVRPGQRIPTDGTILLGTTSVDESVITGESMPVTKTIHDTVIAGTINLDGSIQMLVTHLGDETTLSQIIRLVETAQTSKPSIQALADRVSKVFAPSVFVVSLLTYITWCIVLNVTNYDFTQGDKYAGFNKWTFPLLFSISVLVVACPCALGLAVPTAVMVGSGVGARLGILIKNGEALEQMNNITAVAIDKTGTLTEGRPSIGTVILLSQRCARLYDTDPYNADIVDNIISIDESQESQLNPINTKTLENIFFLAACAENRSQHPLGKGIMTKAAMLGIGPGLKRPLEQAEDFENISGCGIKCTVSGLSVYIGNRRGLDMNQAEISPGTFEAMKSLEKRGQTAVVFALNGKTEAILGFIDKAKDDACLVTSILQHAMGMKVYMLTGDNYRTARIIAGKIGIPTENIVADALPHKKVECIRRLQEHHEKVVMIGDGINDAPALAQADVGIAIGAGSDIALESAGIILVNSRLLDVVATFSLAAKIYRRIRANFFWALGYNVFAIPLAAGALYPITHKVLLPPYIAAITMILSSLSVVTSSLLLNTFKPPYFEKEYGHALRKGQLGLERIKVDGKVSVDVRNICESMESGGRCSCKQGFCVCFPCVEHDNVL